jgi:hypothetical protein
MNIRDDSKRAGNMVNIGALTGMQRKRLWSLVAFNLTVAARETYVPMTEEIAEPSKLRTYNAMLHRVTSQIVALQAQDPSAFPDQSLVQVLNEFAEHSGAVRSLQGALEDALNKSVDRI